jgi:carboxymethylenebutenolidase
VRAAACAAASIRRVGGDNSLIRHRRDLLLGSRARPLCDRFDVAAALYATTPSNVHRAYGRVRCRPVIMRCKSGDARGSAANPPGGPTMHARVFKPAALWAGCFLFLALGVAAAQDKAAPKSNPKMTGSVSEQHFKEMHQLDTSKAPVLNGQMVALSSSQAYLSLPPNAKAPIPGVVVVQEWWGLNNNVKHWADRLAAEGYAALAVDLYGGKVATTPDSAMAYMKAVDPDKATAILLEAHKFLSTDARVKAPKTGSIGWCFGGHWSLRLALAEPELDACVMYYGAPITDVATLRAIKAPLLGVFGNKDESIPPAAVDEFEKSLREAGVKVEILRFDAPHAFANPSNPHYDAEASAAAWKKVQTFFAANLWPTVKQ